MTIDYDPISSLEAVGYLEREASFLYLVAIHSGYFLRRQYSQFVQCDRGAMPTRFLEKASRLRHLRVIECGQGRHIYHLASKPVYEAVGHPDSQNRRIKGDSYIKARLMVLDFVLAHLSANVLEDELGKVDFFTTQCGVRSELLPRSYAGRLMYFPDGFPILVSNTGVPSFVFFSSDTDRRIWRVASTSPGRTGSWKTMVLSDITASGRPSFSFRSKWIWRGRWGASRSGAQ